MFPIITAHHTLVIYNIYIRYMRSGSLLHYSTHLSSRTYYHLVAGLFKLSPAIRVMSQDTNLINNGIYIVYHKDYGGGNWC